MDKKIDLWLPLLEKNRAIAVIRCSQLELGVKMARAVATGGINLIEVTWNSFQPSRLLTRIKTELPHCTVGAGTIIDDRQLEEAITMGAEFIFSPHSDRDLITLAVNADLPIIPGALSPTEIVQAWQAGATCVKIFPIMTMGGASYIKALRSPLENIPLIPTGGVTMENAPKMIQAGAIAVGLASELFPKTLLQQENWQEISQIAKDLSMALKSV